MPASPAASFGDAPRRGWSPRFALLGAVAGSATTGMILVDTEGQVLWANAAADELLGSTLSPHEQFGLLAATTDAVLDLPNGSSIRIDASPGTIDGTDTLLYVLTDVTDDRVRLQHLATEATTDPATGLLNKRGLAQAVATFDTDSSIALLFIDLDGFKAVNDNFGHDVGDAVLRAVAGRLEHLSRDTDVVSRWGGDEFVLVSPNEHAAEHLCRRVEEALAEPTQSDGHRLVLSASLGVATASDGWDLDELLAEADRNMYIEKRRSRAGAAALFVGDDAQSDHVRRVVAERAGGEAIEVVDLRTDVARFEEEQVATTPTLILSRGGHRRQLIGDFGAEDLEEFLDGGVSAG